MSEGGTLQAEKKPDVVGLFDGLLDIGQEFTYIIQSIQESSDGDPYIIMRLDRLIDECVKTGKTEKFYDEVKQLKKDIEENY